MSYWHNVCVTGVTGLKRCRKSCRLRWLNYLSPDIHRGKFMEDEVDLIIRLHKLLGNRWSLIAGRLPGRTANDIKNFWNSHLSKKVGAQHERNHEPISKIQVVKPKPQRVVVTQTNWPICQENNNNNNEAGGSQINQDLIMHKSKQPVADEVINEEEQWLNDLTSTAQAENVMNTEQDFHFLYETEETLQEMVDEELFWGRIYELEKLL